MSEGVWAQSVPDKALETCSNLDPSESGRPSEAPNAYQTSQEAPPNAPVLDGETAHVASQIGATQSHLEDLDSPRIGARPQEWSGSLRRHNYLDFVLYAIFLTIFCAIELQHIHSVSYDAYRLVQSAQTVLITQQTPEPQVAWDNIGEVNGLMHWLQTQFYVVMWGYYPDAPLDDDTGLPADGPKGIGLPHQYLASSFFLGPVRLRQSRVRPDSCSPSKFWRQYDSAWGTYICAAGYSGSSKPHMGYDLQMAWPGLDTTNITSYGDNGVDLSQAFVFRNGSYTKAGWFRGVLPTTTFHYYGPEGYVADIPSGAGNAGVARDWLQGLWQKQWLDAQTRALFIEFSVYLPKQDMCLSARLLVEVHPSGTVLKLVAMEVFPLDPYPSLRSWQLWFRILLVISVVVNIIFELYSMYHLRGLYARRNSATWVWIIAGVLVYVSVIAELILYLISVLLIQRLRYNPDSYFPTHELAYLITCTRSMVSFSSFIIWFRLLKYTSQMPRIGILGRTIGKVLPRVAAFFLMSAVIFLAFAQTFYMVYNPTVQGFQSYWMSFMSVLRFTVGDFDYDALSAEAPVFTPILFCILLIIIFFVWVNLVIAIISTVYEAERELAEGFSWDPVFDTLQPESDHPENDREAMKEHKTTVPGANPLVQPTLIALRPNSTPRLKRFVVQPLKRFDLSTLITVEMELVMGLPEDKQPFALQADPTNQTQASRISPHKGVYARLGKLKMSGGIKRSQTPLQHTDSGAVKSRRHAAPNLQVQALYFNLNYHNLATAQQWWNANKRFFDEREQFMRDITRNVTRIINLPANIVRLTESAVLPFHRHSHAGADASASRRSQSGQLPLPPPTPAQRWRQAGQAHGVPQPQGDADNDRPRASSSFARQFNAFRKMLRSSWFALVQQLQRSSKARGDRAAAGGSAA